MIVKSLDHLNSLSRKVADKLKSNDCIYLIGEIGVGKTTFTRYLINYLQEKEGLKKTEVLSPTFNLLYEYEYKNYKIMHYDLYRIIDEKELNQLGIFTDSLNTVKIIEWPHLIKTPLSEKLEIIFDYTDNENERKIKFVGSGKWKILNEL
tara:strand:+ start:2914 stop:3363 length:450 start_codon:yes stop_codon:yes gene_type:complete